MDKLSIKDRLFSHAFSSSNWFKPTEFEWDFNNITTDFVFLTDHNVYDYASYDVKKYAWLVESPVITPASYDFVYNNHQHFDKIFTHSKRILDVATNAYLLPIGGCHLDENEISCEYEKTKMISLMYSHKNFTPGHSLRHTLSNMGLPNVDVMGSGKSGGHVKKINACKDYRFSIVIENCKEDFYFTEKLIDAFLSGVVPIYWGCPSIGQFFNTDGMILFDNANEIPAIASNTDYLLSFYKEKQEIIKENFNTALRFKICEDYLYSHYRNIL